jgi:hypothetical protein
VINIKDPNVVEPLRAVCRPRSPGCDLTRSADGNQAARS